MKKKNNVKEFGINEASESIGKGNLEIFKNMKTCFNEEQIRKPIIIMKASYNEDGPMQNYSRRLLYTYRWNGTMHEHYKTVHRLKVQKRLNNEKVK